METVYDRIKKQNGEHFARAIRNYDNGIFDIPNIVEIVKYAGSEAEPLMEYLISLKGITIEAHGVYKDPIMLLAEAGYDAYYANTRKKQDAIKKYYEEGEELCTFGSDRFKDYFIVNAVKKDVDKIRREDFRDRETRDDAYGTSVISIQILKTGGFISIKNRYNHHVLNPDNTFNSNPDNIIQGLSNSLRQYFNVDFSSQKVLLPADFVQVNNQIVRYHCEVNNVYIGSDFYLKDGKICEIDKDKEIIMDHFRFNLKTKEITDLSGQNKDSFPEIFKKEIEGKKIQVTKDKNGQHIFANGIEVATVRNGEIVALNLPNTTEVGDRFLYENSKLEKLNMPKLKRLGDGFLYRNQSLRSLNLPSLEEIGDDFLCVNEDLSSLSLPKVRRIGYGFLSNNQELTILNLPSVENIKSWFLYNNKVLRKIICPKLKSVGDDFLFSNEELTSLSLLSLIEAGDNFFKSNTKLATLNAPKARTFGNCFLMSNRALTRLDLQNLREFGYCFLPANSKLKTIRFQNLKKVARQSLVFQGATIKKMKKILDTDLCLRHVSSEVLETALVDLVPSNTQARSSVFNCLKNAFQKSPHRPGSESTQKGAPDTGKGEHD